jgi:hypothetical protein
MALVKLQSTLTGRQRHPRQGAGDVAVELVVLVGLVGVGAVVGVVVVGMVVEGTVVDAGGTVLGVVDGTCVGGGVPGWEAAVVDGTAVVVVSSLDGVVAGGPSSSPAVSNHAPKPATATMSKANTAISACLPRSGGRRVSGRVAPASGGATAPLGPAGVSNTEVALPIITVGS